MSQIDLYIYPVENAPRVWGMSQSNRIVKQYSNLSSLNDPLNHISDLNEVKGKSVILLREDCVYDMAVLDALASQVELAVTNETAAPVGVHIQADHAKEALSWLSGDGAMPETVVIRAASQVGGAYRDALRKQESPYALFVTQSNQRNIEWRLYQGSYKGVTDLVTKYFWPVPAFYVTKLCALLRLSPNMVTTIGAVLMLLALYWFYIGAFIPGLIAGWIMTFLDTVDGKLARVTLTSSKWGNIYDHGIDLIHPPFWYIAWGFGLAAYGTPLAEGMLAPVLTAMFAFYVLGRLCEGYFIHRFDIHIHVWRKTDSVFRLISSRRNPNMIILTLCILMGRPDMGLLVITAWGGITFGIHLVQIAQAEFHARKHSLESWLRKA